MALAEILFRCKLSPFLSATPPYLLHKFSRPMHRSANLPAYTWENGTSSRNPIEINVRIFQPTQKCLGTNDAAISAAFFASLTFSFFRCRAVRYFSKHNLVCQARGFFYQKSRGDAWYSLQSCVLCVFPRGVIGLFGCSLTCDWRDHIA